ncbi:hypothetical protein [Psychrobacillus psychrodurans]|uniref:hypothetical protein n=1 Tax=Psychrobacillus psychrodurans TaxID=126157 RepID=UPI003D079C33
MDGTVRLIGAWLYGVPEHIGIGKQITGDMLGYIVGDNPVGICETDKLYPTEVAKENAAGIIRV